MDGKSPEADGIGLRLSKFSIVMAEPLGLIVFLFICTFWQCTWWITNSVVCSYIWEGDPYIAGNCGQFYCIILLISYWSNGYTGDCMGRQIMYCVNTCLVSEPNFWHLQI